MKVTVVDWSVVEKALPFLFIPAGAGAAVLSIRPGLVHSSRGHYERGACLGLEVEPDR
ncbi:MAG: hypothetical protein NDJ92_17770 [Thermoanaerobaculia bacterium]|nr:hypothetical protein [Thermoanaerobaculia bacterium]